MNRVITAVLALTCAVPLAACDPKEATTAAAAAGITPMIATTIPNPIAVLKAAGASDATIAKAQANAAKAQQFAVAACGFEPTVATVAGLFLAAKPGFATARHVADLACSAVAGRPTYAALAPGETVTRTLDVNGWPVRVAMVRRN